MRIRKLTELALLTIVTTRAASSASATGRRPVRPTGWTRPSGRSSAGYSAAWTYYVKAVGESKLKISINYLTYKSYLCNIYINILKFLI